MENTSSFTVDLLIISIISYETNLTTHDLTSNSHNFTTNLVSMAQISNIPPLCSSATCAMLLMLFILIFPDFSLPPSANNINNNKAHKINKTSNGKKFFYCILFHDYFLCIENFQYISTTQKMQHTHQHMCNYILCTSISYVSCNAFFCYLECVLYFSLLALALCFFFLLQINI